MNHTPGPWTWICTREGDDKSLNSNVGSIIGSTMSTVCDFGTDEEYYPTEGTPPNKADLALILAAPALFAACKATLEARELGLPKPALELCRAAIALAEGN